MPFGIGKKKLAAYWFNRATIIGRISTAPQWLPVLIGISISTGTFFVWQALIVEERTQIEQMIQLQSSAVNKSVAAQLQTRIKALQRIGKRWEAWGGIAKANWEYDAMQNIKDFAGFQAIEWLDSTFHVRWIVPLAGNETALNQDLSREARRRVALEIARNRREVTGTRSINLFQGGKGFLVYVPMFQGENFGGFIVGVFRIQELLDTILEDDENLKRGYSITVSDGEEEIYSRNVVSRQHSQESGQETTINLHGVSWRIRVWPTPQLLAKTQSPFPQLVLLGGLLLASLLALTVHLAQKTRQKQHQAEVTNLELEGEIAARKQTEAALLESEKRFKFFMNNSPAVAFIKDEQGRFVYINEPFERCFNIKLANLLGKTDFDVWPSEIALQFRENDTRVLTEDRTVEMVETVPALDGCLHYWLSFKFPIKDVSGQRLLGGVAVDITEHKQANEKLTVWVNELEQRNREIALLSNISDFLQACRTVEEAYTALKSLMQPLFPQLEGGIYLINASKNLLEAVATWGSSPLPSLDVFAPDQCWALRRGRLHQVENTHSGLVCNHVHLNELPAECVCVPMMAQGEALGVLYLSTQELGRLTPIKQQLAKTVAEQIALALANLKLRQTLERQSIRDPLTGLFNRRYMEDSLARELIRCERARNPLSIIMIDIDHFKRFNDTFGHEAGDTVLRELGHFLQKYIRGSDIACRYGGEELTLILPEASIDIVRHRAEQIREATKHLNVQYQGQPLGAITLSLGVACFPEHGSTGEAVIRAADAALYRAKKSGRDRVVCAINSTSPAEDIDRASPQRF
ncbi:diguanylate cyclase [Tolypothrix campylonemoides VB511288]|nr:diguanylate cyclase [Tolypothrix campylonemoides VB511288]